MAKPIPDGFHTITPSFTFKDCKQALDFYKKAFDVEVLDYLAYPDGRGVMHAAIQIGNSILMMGDEIPSAEMCSRSAETMGGSPISLYVYVPDVDASFKQAVAAGGTVTMPVSDSFWGDRVGQIKDPFGYSWMIATHTRDLSKEEIVKGAEVCFSQKPNQ